MTDFDGPRPPRRSELPSLQRLLEVCFPGELPEGPVARWPHVFSDEKRTIDGTIVMAHRDRVVASVTCHPVSMIVSGVRVSAASVCFVATDPEFRGHGLMSGCLGRAIELMRSWGAALSWLIGDRVRYGRYGWENAMRKYLFVITPRSLAVLPDARFELRDTAAAEALLLIHNQKDPRVERDRQTMKTLLSRARKQMLVAFSKGRPAAYLAFERPRTAGRAIVFEHGGTPAAVGALLRACFEEPGIEELLVSSPVGRDPSRAALFAAASTWRLDPGYIEFSQGACHMVKILNLERLLRGFARQMQARRKTVGDARAGRVALGIDGTDQMATVSLGSRVTVARGASRTLVRLDERQMVRLLFGTASPDEEIACPPLLSGALPLDLFVSPLEDT
jgi:GNAT superfamily N-acetyltransferase